MRRIWSITGRICARCRSISDSFRLSGVGAGWMAAPLQIGFFYLCALPSTVSSSVALTIAARGNVAAAVLEMGMW